MSFAHGLIVLLMLSSVALLYSPISYTLETLVENGGFETGDFTYWTAANSKVVRNTDRSPAHSGEYSARIATETSEGRISQIISIPFKCSGKFNVWYRVEDQAQLAILLKTIDGLVIRRWIVTNTESWTSLTYNLDLSYGGRSVTIEFVGYKNSVWGVVGPNVYYWPYVDDVSLTCLAQTVTTSVTTTSLTIQYATTTSPAPVTTIRTVSPFTETAAPPSALTGMPFGTLELAGLVAVVALISSVLVLMRRRRGPGQTATLKQKVEVEAPLVKEIRPVAPARETVVPEVKAAVKYCVNCGAEMLADALYCPTCASGALSPACDRTLGLERLEHAAVQASVIVRHMEVKIGEDATLELQMINAGKKPATLVKIENVIPAGFELVSGPEPYHVVRDDLHLKGRRLDPMKTEEIELVLRPRRRGSFLLKPRIFYLDEDGNYRYHEPEPVTITVKEIGLRGWVAGPE